MEINNFGVLSTRIPAPKEMRLARLGELLIDSAKKSLKSNPGEASRIARALHEATEPLVTKLGIGVPGPGVNVEEYKKALHQASNKLYLEDGADIKRHGLRSAAITGLEKTINDSFQYKLDWNELPSNQDLLTLIKSNDANSHAELLEKLQKGSLVQNILKMHLHVNEVARKSGWAIGFARKMAAADLQKQNPHIDFAMSKWAAIICGYKPKSNPDIIFEDDNSIVAYDIHELAIYAIPKNKSIPGLKINFKNTTEGDTLTGFSLFTSENSQEKASIDFNISDEFKDRFVVKIKQPGGILESTDREKEASKFGLRDGETLIDLKKHDRAPIKTGFEALRNLSDKFQAAA